MRHSEEKDTWKVELVETMERNLGTFSSTYEEGNMKSYPAGHCRSARNIQ